MSGLDQVWGLGANLVFNAGSAIANMSRAETGAEHLRGTMQRLRDGVSGIGFGLGQIGLALTPLAAGFGLAASRSSGLAAELEAQRVTFRTLIGNVEQADAMIERLRATAARTPFETSELLAGSKQLLSLTGSNIEANERLLGLAMQLTALNPDKTIVDTVRALNDAIGGSGFVRMEEYPGFKMYLEDFKSAGKAGGANFQAAVEAEIRGRLGKLTGGRDLVDALSQTFQGRLSTLRDSVDLMLTQVGERINERVGARFAPASEAVGRFAERVVGAVDSLVGRLDVLGGHLAPFADQVSGLWSGLGAEGQEALLQVAIAGGALVSVLLPIGAAVGALGLLGGGIVTVGSGIAAVAAAIPMTGTAVWALAAAASAASVAFAYWEPISGAIWALGEGIMYSLGPTAQIVMTAAAVVVDDLSRAFGSAFGSMGGQAEDFANVFRGVGVVVGEIAASIARVLAGTARVAGTMIEIVAGVVGPLLGSLFEIAFSIGDILSGAEGGWMRFGTAIARTITALVVGVVNLLIGSVETLIRSAGVIADSIPGMRALTGNSIGGAADGLTRIRRDLDATVARTFGGLDRAKADGAAASRAAPQAVAAPAASVAVQVQTSVQVAGREVARANGAERVRAGERGAAAPIAGPAIGRVLRHGSNEIGSLGALEALSPAR
jgi:hypothetical protein